MSFRLLKQLIMLDPIRFFVFTIEHRRHQFSHLLPTVEHRPNQAHISERHYARAARSSLLAERLAGLWMSNCALAF